MKNSLLLLALAATFTFSSCGKDDDKDNGPSGAPDGGMTAKVDGTQWTAQDENVQMTSMGTMKMLTASQVSGSASQTIQFTLTGVDAAGTYGSDKVIANYTTMSGTTAQSWSTMGGTGNNVTFVITSLDEENGATGTFSFTATGANGATGTKTVTDGSFKNVVF